LKDQAGESDPSFSDKVEKLFKGLASIDHYSFLGIDRLATSDDIKKAYYNAAKEFHPDRHLQSNTHTLKYQLNEIFAHLTEVYKVLSDRRLRAEYDISLSDRVSRSQTGKIALAQIRYKEGRDAFRRGAYSEAAELFGQAIYLDNTAAAYYFHLGLALEKEKKINDAGRVLNQALKLEPLNAEYIAELGHIYLKLGFNLRARTAFEKALKFDPHNERAAEGLQTMKDRRSE